MQILQLRIPVRQGLQRDKGLQSFGRLVNTAVHSNAEASQSTDELKSRDAAGQEAKLTAEQLAQSINDAADEAVNKARTEQSAESPDAAQSFGSQSASARMYDSATESARESSSGASESRQTTEEAQESSDRHQDGWQEARDDSSEGQSSSQGKDQGKPLSLAERLRSFYQLARKEVAEAVLPRQETMSATKARDPSIKPAGNPQASGLTIVKQEETGWRKQWTHMQDKLGKHPFFQRLHGLSDNAAFNKGRDLADNLRERWETSDSRFVQRIQDMRDNFAVESEPAQALREIRSRYPDFDMVHFVRMLKTDVPTVIKAYLEGDLTVLKEHSSPEMMERFTGIINAQKAEGLLSDSTILYTSDVELFDLKFVEGDPVVVVQFSCQQINCTRDKFGNVVEGHPTDVQRVYYFWALQQEDAGFVGEDGSFHPPRWQLREMLVRGMHNLL